MSPYQGKHAEKNTPQPLRCCQMGCGEGSAAKLDNDDLRDESTEQNRTEDPISENAGEDVSFAVYLPGVDFIEDLHEYEGVEDNCEMLRWSCVQGETTAVVNVEQNISFEKQYENDGELIYGVSDDVLHHCF